MESKGLKYDVDEGGGAFYGPKIDLQIRDAMSRSWQCTTIQFDFNLPERFDLYYIDSKGEQQRPYMIHRAIFGSLERFFGIMVEHYGGYFPLWLAPVQAQVIPITDKQHDFAAEVAAKLRAAGIRAELDQRSEQVGYKIREAEVQKVPYMLIIGAREAEAGTVSLRRHGEGDLGAVSVEEVSSRLLLEIENKELPPVLAAD